MLVCVATRVCVRVCKCFRDREGKKAKIKMLLARDDVSSCVMCA